MSRKSVAQDLFMQWYPIEITLDAADSSSLEINTFTTGLSIRGEYAWLIHCVEVNFDSAYWMTTLNKISASLATKPDYAAVPGSQEQGVIFAAAVHFNILTSGGGIHFEPYVWHSLPPTIIAAPRLTLYAASAVDLAGLRGTAVVGRLGYTTVPIEDKTYLEIAETFEVL